MLVHKPLRARALHCLCKKVEINIELLYWQVTRIYFNTICYPLDKHEIYARQLSRVQCLVALIKIDSIVVKLKKQKI